MKYFQAITIFGVFVFFLGCAEQEPQEIQKAPRPVKVQTLTLDATPGAIEVAASAASWKTEQIGFEVSGRIKWVIEPNENIEGRIVDSKDEGKILIEGTKIAEIDDERYRLQVESAKRDVEKAEESVEAAEIELELSIPAQIRAAEAELRLAKIELERSQRLVNQKAGAQADVDRDLASKETATAKIEQLRAQQKAKGAELRSLNSQVKRANQALRDAERNLEDCTLYSSFHGQIAEVHVVPGSLVAQGNPAATVQMMDPIKIELEVSAEDSRRLSNRQRIPVKVKQGKRRLGRTRRISLLD